jgi:hypothetical protein
MTTTAVGRTREQAAEGSLRSGSWLMGIAAVGFIGYAVIFFVRNFTDSFLELGIGPNEVHTGKDAIQQFSPSLFHYISHLHIAVSGFIAATGWRCCSWWPTGSGAGSCGPGWGRWPPRWWGWRWHSRPTTPTTSTPWATWGSSTWPP